MSDGFILTITPLNLISTLEICVSTFIFIDKFFLGKLFVKLYRKIVSGAKMKELSSYLIEPCFTNSEYVF
jgi:hypothetical protein